MEKLPPHLQIAREAVATVSLEGDGVTRQELELVYYGRIVDFDDLKHKSDIPELHEQWEIRGKADPANQHFGSIRVRKTTVNEESHFELTVKSIDTHSESAGKAETEADITEDMFENFKRIANAGMIKTRYKIPFHGPDDEELMWEIDVYTNPKGDTSEWVKIDLEVPEGFNIANVPDFPIELRDVITAQPKDRTEEEKAQVERLMQEEFLQKNPFPSKQGQQVTTTESAPVE